MHYNYAQRNNFKSRVRSKDLRAGKEKRKNFWGFRTWAENWVSKCTCFFQSLQSKGHWQTKARRTVAWHTESHGLMVINSSQLSSLWLRYYFKLRPKMNGICHLFSVADAEITLINDVNDASITRFKPWCDGASPFTNYFTFLLPAIYRLHSYLPINLSLYSLKDERMTRFMTEEDRFLDPGPWSNRCQWYQ